MSWPDVIEFYHGDRMIGEVDSAMKLPEGSYISIRGETWQVSNTTYALDYADDRMVRRMRANVNIERVK